MSSLGKWFGVLVVLAASAFLLLQVGAFIQFGTRPFISASITPTPEMTVFEVRRGQTPQEIAAALQQQRLISDATLFIWWGKVNRSWGKIKAGEYGLSPTMSPKKIFDVITSGISLGFPITVREGENMYEIATRVEQKGFGTKKDFLALCRDADFISKLGFDAPQPLTLEGYLFPDTYLFSKKATQVDIIKKMVKRFHSVWGEAEKTRATQIGMKRNELITLASMVEKETGAGSERPVIASVFYNRLRKKMRLQSDPTTIYGMWSNYTGNIRKSDLLTANPYNTYMIPALPIGPISNPGREAIQAALNPAETEFLFFVSHNDGTHEFTKTYEEHVAAVKRYQIDPKARQGKSWRNLGKQSPAGAAGAVGK